jgi:hypothetical protein
MNVGQQWNREQPKAVRVLTPGAALIALRLAGGRLTLRKAESNLQPFLTLEREGRVQRLHEDIVSVTYYLEGTTTQSPAPAPPETPAADAAHMPTLLSELAVGESIPAQHARAGSIPEHDNDAAGTLSSATAAEPEALLEQLLTQEPQPSAPSPTERVPLTIRLHPETLVWLLHAFDGDAPPTLDTAAEVAAAILEIAVAQQRK